MNTNTRREVRAWGRAAGIIVTVAATAAVLIVAGLSTLSF
jgi:hypothetical protein